MGKIATWQDIRDKGIVFIATGLNMNQCPQKSDITSKIPSPSIEISGSYANNQLVQEADISKPSVEYTIDILFRVEGNTPDVYKPYAGKPYSVSSLPVGVTLVSGNMSGTTRTAWFMNTGGFCTAALITVKKTNKSAVAIKVTLDGTQYSTIISTISPAYVRLG